MTKGNKKSKTNARGRLESEFHDKQKAHKPTKSETAVQNNPGWTPRPMTGNFSVDGIPYRGRQTRTEALYYVSHSHYPKKLFPPGNMCYNHPTAVDSNVIVYVMEKSYSMEDFPDGLHRNRLKFLEGKPCADLQPEHENGGHGAQVLSILAGAKYGAGPWCTIYAVGRSPIKNQKNSSLILDWPRALQAVVNHFLKKKESNKSLKAVMNISCGFTNSGPRLSCLQRAARAGIIVVGAAGDDSVDFDQLRPGEMKLPEAADPNTAIIIGSLNEDGDPGEKSNRGHRVDYWVMGSGIAYADKSSDDGMGRTPVDPQSSFATAIASGVIAYMIGTGQAGEDPNIASVRKTLDQWAYKGTGGLKHLKNAPGLRHPNLNYSTPINMSK